MCLKCAAHTGARTSEAPLVQELSLIIIQRTSTVDSGIFSIMFELFAVLQRLRATFFANPNDDNEPWIENPALEGYGFRNWHLMFFCFSGLLAVFILICCCVKIRIPRTKQEIEGDYRRKKLAEKFQERLRLIQNQNNLMDSMDLQEALRIIQEDFDNENRKINEKIALGALPESNTVPQDNPAGFVQDRFTRESESQPPIVIAKTVITNILLSSKVNP